MNINNLNPKITYIKSKDIFSISYDYSDYGRQYFNFDGNVFLIAYNTNKHNLPLTLSNYYKLNEQIITILNNFTLNPTILKRCYNHKGKFSLPLKLKITTFKPRGSHNKKINQNFVVDNTEVQRCIDNQLLAIQKASTTQDLNFFEQFYQATIDLQIALGLKSNQFKGNSKLENQSLKDFIKKVEIYKSSLYNNNQEGV